MQNQNTLRHPRYIDLKQQIDKCWKFTTLDVLQKHINNFYQQVKGTEHDKDVIDLIRLFKNKKNEILKPFTPCSN